MEIQYTEAENCSIDRVYGIDAILRNFKGCQHLEITLFRAGQTAEELAALKTQAAEKGITLVGEPDPDVPKEVLQGASEDAAITYILENFTKAEVDQFLPYLKERYADLIEKVIVAPLAIPVPLGAGSLGRLPVTSESGFINFDKAPNYPLPFAVRAYFDFRLQDELSEDQA